MRWGKLLIYLGFGTQSKVYKLQVVVFVNQQVFLQFKTSGASAVKIRMRSQILSVRRNQLLPLPVWDPCVRIPGCGRRPTRTLSVWRKPWSPPLTDGLLLWCSRTTPHLDSTEILKEKRQRGRKMQNYQTHLHSHTHTLEIACSPPAPWRSGWRSQWHGTDDRRADDSGSSWPQSPPSHEAGQPEGDRPFVVLLFLLMYNLMSYFFTIE